MNLTAGKRARGQIEASAKPNLTAQLRVKNRKRSICNPRMRANLISGPPGSEPPASTSTSHAQATTQRNRNLLRSSQLCARLVFVSKSARPAAISGSAALRGVARAGAAAIALRATVRRRVGRQSLSIITAGTTVLWGRTTRGICPLKNRARSRFTFVRWRGSFRKRGPVLHGQRSSFALL